MSCGRRERSVTALFPTFLISLRVCFYSCDALVASLKVKFRCIIPFR
jgi:hypothetical protein